MFVIVKAKPIYEGVKVGAIWGPYMTEVAAKADMMHRAKDFQSRRAARFRYETGFRMDTDLREVDGALHLRVWRCYGDDERFPPDLEHWTYRVVKVDETPAGGNGILELPPPSDKPAEEADSGYVPETRTPPSATPPTATK